MKVTDPEYIKTHEFWNAGHFNENMAAGIAIKTTGPDPDIHEIMQICVFPLTSKFELSKKIIPFYTDIRPVKDEADFMLNKSNLSDDKLKSIFENVQDIPQLVAEQFDRWMENKIKLRFSKKLLPVVYNWAYIKPFIRNWLGPINFNSYFSHEYRDLMSAALYCNDYSDINNHEVIYPKVSLQYITNRLHIDYNRFDDTILIVKSICESYRAMMKMSQFRI